MSEEIKVRSSSGTIFTDIGLANSSYLLIKAELVRQISELISCCASNLTVNFSTILVGRAGEPVSVFNLDA